MFYVFAIMLAQVQPGDATTPPLDLGALIQSLFTAWNGHAYVLVAALVVATLVALAKQGHFSAWLAAHLPSKSLPFVAVILGVLATTAGQIQAGVPWTQALINGVLAGFAAIAGHQTFIESMRGGKEIVPPSAKVAAQSPPQDPPVSPPGSTVVKAAVLSVKPSAGVATSSQPSTQPKERQQQHDEQATGKAAISGQQKPPSAARLGRAFAVACALSAVTLTTAVALPGCAAWWQQFTANPGKFAQDFASYVELALQAAVQVWTLLAPMLGAGAADATAKFNAAVSVANNSLGALLDAVHAAVEAQTANPDFSKLISDCQDAFARVMAIVAEFKAKVPAPALGAQADQLTHQAQVIASWRAGR